MLLKYFKDIFHYMKKHGMQKWENYCGTLLVSIQAYLI